jgi:hypothetical protein
MSVVITALAARSVWLLTLDEGDFHGKLGREVYGLKIATPGEFLLEQRAQGVLQAALFRSGSNRRNRQNT